MSCKDNYLRSTIRVGITEPHGMAIEQSQIPASGVYYSFLEGFIPKYRIVRSPIKGYFRHFDNEEIDLIEAVLSPIITKNRWVYSLACFQEAMAFNLLNMPLPRSFRLLFIKYLFLRKNFKKLIFWSHAGLKTLKTYGGINDEKLLKKSIVVYPAIRKVADNMVRFNESKKISILFSGDFFRKGGVNVIDAFELAQEKYPSIKLRLCCDRDIDFNGCIELKNEYLEKISSNGNIKMGRVPREELINNILPDTDIYLLPTYNEAFGFAVLEAMAYGIPVIATNYFAIPEMIESGESGFLIDTSTFDCEKLFQGYIIKNIPETFRNHITKNLFDYLCLLIESPDLRKQIGLAGLKVATIKFSFETHNKTMLSLYREAIS